jgi:molybdopterin converting factor small subunit
VARVTVTLPGALTFPDRRVQTECDADDVGDALRHVVEAYPQFGQRLFRPDGSLAVTVLLNGASVRTQAGLGTGVQDGDRLTLLVPLSGG